MTHDFATGMTSDPKLLRQKHALFPARLRLPYQTAVSSALVSLLTYPPSPPPPPRGYGSTIRRLLFLCSRTPVRLGLSRSYRCSPSGYLSRRSPFAECCGIRFGRLLSLHCRAERLSQLYARRYSFFYPSRATTAAAAKTTAAQGKQAHLSTLVYNSAGVILPLVPGGAVYYRRM